MNLRISTGIYKNRKLKVPTSARPVKERVKQSVLSILQDKISDSLVLDLFCGSGNLGIECLSMGAKHCTFVDSNYEAVKFTESNLNEIKHNKYDIYKKEAIHFIDETKDTYDLILIDPPYEQPITHILKLIHTKMKKDTLLVCFMGKNTNYEYTKINKNLKLIKTKKYGGTIVDFISRN